MSCPEGSMTANGCALHYPGDVVSSGTPPPVVGRADRSPRSRICPPSGRKAHDCGLAGLRARRAEHYCGRFDFFDELRRKAPVK